MVHLASQLRPHSSFILSRPSCRRYSHRSRSLSTPSALLNFFKRDGQPTVGNGQAVVELLDALSGTERGLNTSKEKENEIVCAVDALAEIGSGSVTTGDDLSATWKLLWTTEKETLFILKNAKWFGTQAGEVYQVIDTKTGSLQNVIMFPPDGAFVVTSSIDVESDQRVNFKFNKAKLQLPGNREIGIPPVGQGWFESVYMDEDIRVAKDIRGDTLIVQRDGAPRQF